MDDRPLAQRLADGLMKGKLEEFVRARRAEGRPWRLIARDLYDVSGQHIDVTDQTLRKWFPDAPDTAGVEPEPNGDTRVA